ncbi:hypothetical protein SAMN05518801_10459 [Novosphingobium sp. CF614]|uniref:hypothetical protein n=1 Tax=Novosphingobium sp. CF614 TaxID=1884364 RepID=UPI0008ED1FC1|nr:hypothetical protein [Novosphingobium sp. CF614]SFF94664.1 hypothetical protein SAMN05518801_10459 [Novosphingobium sp. CF614]
MNAAWGPPAPKSQRTKLLLSLAVNFATRIPGAVGIFLILPLLRFDLGVRGYGFLLGALALGSTSTFLFGGFNTMGRRLVGEAHAARDREGEAAGVVSMFAVNGCVYLLTLAGIGAYAAVQPDPGTLFLIASLVSTAAFANTFDNARAAYNEHYVTALFQIVFQVILIGLAFLVRPIRENPVLAALAIQGHLLLASLVAGVHLVSARPYLLGGAARRAGWIARGGFRIGIADGLLAASLGLSVVWMQAGAPASLAGWYATLVRLFQSFAVPVMLLLMPLSSYVRLGWNDRDPGRQDRILRTTAIAGLGYGVMASTALWGISVFYIETVLKLPGPASLPVAFAIFALFAAIIACRSYSTIAYVVTDGARIARWITGGILVSLGIAVAVRGYLAQIQTVAVYAALASVVLLVAVLAGLAGQCQRGGRVSGTRTRQ